MNPWTALSVEFANQRNYLDELFRVYPTVPEGLRQIDSSRWAVIESAFSSQDSGTLIRELLALDLFPIKDSYVAYLKRDRAAVDRNPRTVARLCSRLYEMGLSELYVRCSQPKETNRQIGPLFRRWIRSGALGVPVLSRQEFLSTNDDAILDESDLKAAEFARRYLGYSGEKGLDLIARFNRRFVVGEAKFLTDFGGHQNAQFDDARRLIEDASVDAVKVAILDGVVYIPGSHKMFQYLEMHPQYNVLSALLLREFLYQL